jgi:hypothetical protein
VTEAVREVLGVRDACFALQRHVEGDWGGVDEHVRSRNEVALVHRITSKHESENGVRFWIITEADRSVTTILLSLDD